MKSNKITLSLMVLVVFELSGCAVCRYREVNCPGDGRPISLAKSEKCAEEMYKDAVKQFDVSLKATVNVIDQVTVGIDNISVKNNAVLLKDKLDNESIRFEQTLKASFLALRIDPCANSARHYKLLDAINDKNYKLQEIKAELANETNVAKIAATLDNYSKGKIDGINMRKLILAIDAYYTQQQKYPENLESLNVSDLIETIGNSRLDYRKENDQKYNLQFAGEDYVLKTPDDKIYIGQNGTTTRQN